MPDNEFPDEVDFNDSDESPEVDMEVAASLGVSEDELARQPRWKQLKMGKIAERARKAETQAEAYKAALEEQRRMNAEIAERLQRLEQGGSSKGNQPEPEGLARYKTDEIREALLKAERAIHRAAVSPDDEEARKNAAMVTPELVNDLRAEIRRREREQDLAGLRSELTSKEQAAAAQGKLQNKLRAEYGNDVLDMNSDLMKLAAEKFKKRAQDYGISQDNGALTVWAIDEAHRELNGRDRGGRGPSEADRRRLAVEGQIRREVETHNVIAALKNKGDWKSDTKANQIELEQWLGAVRESRSVR